MENKILGLLGLARRGGAIIIGDSILPLFGRVKSLFIIIAKDCSENTKKKWHDKCSYYNIPCIEYETKSNIGHSLGKQEVSVIGITNTNMIKKINQLLKDGDEDGTNE
ncbi:MAG: ribosomal L7Ae/L30e/S12e/Gadd45 family protein [Bacilli bacterium]|nr:ribosomal L7Ae/L30e/S12e/Gadd45 family protein [Bacilli bacterium]